jgi:hypothetical protein
VEPAVRSAALFRAMDFGWRQMAAEISATPHGWLATSHEPEHAQFSNAGTFFCETFQWLLARINIIINHISTFFFHQISFYIPALSYARHLWRSRADRSLRISSWPFPFSADPLEADCACRRFLPQLVRPPVCARASFCGDCCS